MILICNATTQYKLTPISDQRLTPYVSISNKILTLTTGSNFSIHVIELR